MRRKAGRKLSDMKTRLLGRSGLSTSAIGLGCMGMSQGYGPIDDDRSAATLRTAIECGITLWDTAQSYGAGHNEELLSNALRDCRDVIQIATKVGIARIWSPAASCGFRRRSMTSKS